MSNSCILWYELGRVINNDTFNYMQLLELESERFSIFSAQIILIYIFSLSFTPKCTRAHMHYLLMNMDKAKEVCPDGSKWRSLVDSSGKYALEYVCMFIIKEKDKGPPPFFLTIQLPKNISIIQCTRNYSI